jgi:hypothetical protein
MNRNTGGNRGMGLLVAVAGVALLAAACGGGSHSSPSAGGTAAAKHQKELAYSQCMRSHGEPSFPDPNSNGGFAIQGKGAVDLNSGTMGRANQVCRHLLPNGGQANTAQQQQIVNQLLKFARCMRTHGVPSFPDPKVSGNGAGLRINNQGINENSPQFKAAQRACQSLMPGGNGVVAGPGGGQ